MKQVSEYLKASTGGDVLVPLVLLNNTLSEAAKFIVALATAITYRFRSGTFGTIESTRLLALVLLLVISFIFGAALLRITILCRIGGWRISFN
jgi:hypothetical protein